MEEKELKQLFVGKKFEKFEKKVFSIPAFLFGGMYFAYRKMFIHAILVSIVVDFVDTVAIHALNIPLMITAILCIHIAVGLFFPIWYKKFYNNKVRKIMAETSGSSNEVTIKLIQKNGGTSLLYIIIFIIINSILTGSLNNFVQNNLFSNVQNISSNETTTSNFIENVQFSGIVTGMNDCSLYTQSDGDSIFYACTEKEGKLLYLTSSYDELSADIYYTDNSGKRTITSYKLYNNETNEDLTSYTDEASIISALGYYSLGSHEENLTLIENDKILGSGFENGVSYTYYTYMFENESGKQLEFTYKIYDSTNDKSSILVENQKYKVKFNVEEGIFDYDYVITDIETL